MSGWQAVTAAVHGRSGRIFCQLWHCGCISHPDYHGGEPPAWPPAIRPGGQAVTYEGLKDFVTPRALEAQEIRQIVADYAHAADCALQAGFDGVEIHAANGYLIDQFLRDGSNRRTDAYGGPVDNRARLLLEVLEAVIDVWGADRVGVRLSPLNLFNDMRDSDPETTFTRTVDLLNRLRTGYLHITEAGRDAPGEAGPAFDLVVLHQTWKGVYVTNGGYDKARANAVITGGAADAVAFGTLFLANPDPVERFRLD